MPFGQRTTLHQTAAGEPLKIEWRQPHDMGGLSLKVWILTILTLGIYRFWGKTEVRRRLWNAVSLNGQPFEYTGTGWELFLGFLVVLLVLGLPFILLIFGLVLLLGPDNPMTDLVMIPVYVVSLYLFGVAVYRAMRYRLRRTRWRGIRGTMTGSPWRYGWTYFWTFFTLPLTLGWSAPWRQVKLARALTNDMRFGDMPFKLDASWKPLLRPFAAMWLTFVAAFAVLFVPVALSGGNMRAMGSSSLLPILAFAGLLLAGAWMAIRYRAISMNYLTGRTRIGNASFELSITPGGLLALFLTNLLIVIFTLGIFTPVTLARAVRYVVQRLRINGVLDLAAISQAADKLEGMGEGLADAFEIDAF